MRIIAGSARGIRLAAVPKRIRPTADRVREAIFNYLGQFFEGGEVLDLYAGTGALGIEAASRGCEQATFVEKNGRVVHVIRENLARAGLLDRGEVVRGDVTQALGHFLGEGRRYDLIFADPPYRMPSREIRGVLERLVALLAPGGCVVFESGDPPAIETIKNLKGVSRRYGGTVVTFFERTETTMNLAIYPGSFDPVTVGHLDIIERASVLYDHLVVAVGANLNKEPRLSAEERAQLIEKVTVGFENVSVEVMEGLLVDFARERGAGVIVKGLRVISDFESEFQQAQLNRKLYPDLETVYVMAVAEHSFLSSSAVREIASYGGEVRGLVPEEILDTVRQSYVDKQAVASDKG
ncbi:MAG TPA: pantetheine-phosphate adenylyltransferase [Rubrobacteraceae bacterium]|nr:pantetheine-phosphate adenylyltransferase [Rubrobacteraceae bacterium]